MLKQRLLFVIAVSILSFMCLSSGAVMAQSEPVRTPVETSYEVTLNVVTGSNDSSQKSELPQNLSAIAKQLKANFGFGSFRIVDSYLGRLGNNGAIQYKSLTDIAGRQPQDVPSFLDWQISGLKAISAGGGPDSFFINTFRFGARVPIRTSSNFDSAGKPLTSVVYESIGLTVDRMTLGQNSPVLIGTIALPNALDRIFLVLTVKPANN